MAIIEIPLAFVRLAFSGLAKENVSFTSPFLNLKQVLDEAIYCLILFSSVPLIAHLFLCSNLYAQILKDQCIETRESGMAPIGPAV
ncbi:hypothetical protein DSO57_1027097 [Entomophthora muscae]|uniref:Uncharacterized protein n=1 Tax=Entomophthora muscae TaxID=34485 RepID=A0ACC2SQR6_9FUNG|nr:hypothetical protein DSO57_1027097 [Entomophthora muscae]